MKTLLRRLVTHNKGGDLRFSRDHVGNLRWVIMRYYWSSIYAFCCSKELLKRRISIPFIVSESTTSQAKIKGYCTTRVSLVLCVSAVVPELNVPATVSE